MGELKKVTTLSLGGHHYTVVRKIPIRQVVSMVQIPVPVINDPLKAQQGILLMRRTAVQH